MSGHERLDEENPAAQAHADLHDDHLIDEAEHSTTTNNTTSEQDNNQPISSPTTSAVAWKISVRTLTGQNIPVELDSPDTALISDVKNRLENQMNVPASFMRLIYAGRELVDSNKVLSYGIKEGDAVHLVLRQNPPAPSAPRATPDDASVARGDYQALAIPAAVGGGDNNRVLESWQLGRAVKMFSIVDGIFLLLWAFSMWPLVFAVLLAICGFYGATHYKLRYVCLYVVYLLFSIGIRIYWMTAYQSFFLTLVLVLGVLIEFYILNITLKFIKVIRRLTPADRAELAALHAPAFGF